jgi:hypothetical protein
MELVDEIKKSKECNTNVTYKESVQNLKGKSEGKASFQKSSVFFFFRCESFLWLSTNLLNVIYSYEVAVKFASLI